MNINLEYLLKDDSLIEHQTPPQPGEIWEVRQNIDSTMTNNRYVMIVNTIANHIYSGILISTKTEFLSDFNLIIPQKISGISQDLLAETWHLIKILDYHLIQKVGNRLSRDIYDLLLDLYDIKSLGDTKSTTKISNYFGLIKGNKNQNIINFEQEEIDWAKLIQKEVLGYEAYNLTSQILEALITNEQELESLNAPVIVLNQWLEDIFASGWQKLSDLFSTQEYNLSYSLRNETEMVAIQGVKTLNLEEQTIAIIMAIKPENNCKLSIEIKIIPQENKRYLPKNLQVNILSKDEEVIKSFETRNADNCLKLPKMKLAQDSEVTLEIISGSIIIREKFIND